MSRPLQLTWRILATLAVLAALSAALVVWLNLRGESDIASAEPPSGPLAALAPDLERGAYLARAGNCMGCHTVAGGGRYAGGRSVDTPFGAVMAPNITPHIETGIGSWTAADFWRAMHHGRSRDGRLLYPAFPYPSFTHVTRADTDALFAYLRSLPAIDQRNAPSTLRFPYNTQAALAVWRALYFKPGGLQADTRQSDDWNRGRYLVQGLGHCTACHSSRNVLGGTKMNAEFAGGLMPDASWYAPSLASPKEAGLQQWPREDVVRLLKTGVSTHASVSGPMAEVVFFSTQYLTEEDLGAMAQYLASIALQEPRAQEAKEADVETLALGARLYEQRCASCHGDRGQGVPGMYPALAGNRAVLMASPSNLVQIIRRGGFMPTTAGNPRPFGMPPFGQVMNDQEIAAVTTFIRKSWGNSANPVTPLDVLQVR